MVAFLTTPLIALALAGAEEPQPASSHCGSFPAAVRESRSYGGMSDCYLRDIGQEPLWRGAPEGSVQVMRFSFLHGHALFFRTVRIDTLSDGTGVLTYDGEDRAMPRTASGLRRPSGPIPKRVVSLSAEQMTRIEELVAGSGTFEHDIGTWDGEDLYLHCQTLDMERVNADGYRFSSVNIGCNHPRKLKPLVDEIATLAGMEIINGGRLYR
ncbi:MAG: hypothetical protein QNJ15_02615 [Erythrobacter sp.]|nr:hypothetical protein [Erythrobacter sp.]